MAEQQRGAPGRGRPRPRRAPPKLPRPPAPLPTWTRPERLIVGRVLAPHGIDGAVRIELMTQFPERLPGLRRLYLGDEDQPRRVRRASVHPPYAFLRLSGITTEEQARAVQGQLLRIDHDQAAPLAEGEYFHWQLIGASVVDEQGTALGVVAEIIETGANDVYVVRSATGPEILLPAIGEVIRRVDTEQGVITVHLLPGLVDDRPPPSTAPPAGALQLDAADAAVDVQDLAGDERGGIG